MLKIAFDKSARLRQWGLLLGEFDPNAAPVRNKMFGMRRNLENARDKEVRKKENEAE